VLPAGNHPGLLGFESRPLGFELAGLDQHGVALFAQALVFLFQLFSLGDCARDLDFPVSHVNQVYPVGLVACRGFRLPQRPFSFTQGQWSISRQILV
jgi:hypothetical protein